MSTSPPAASPGARLAALGIVPPPAPKPAANYVTATQSGRIVFLAGQGPLADGKVVFAGRVGRDLTEQQGYEAARLTIHNSLAILREHAGSLDRVTRVLKLLAWVHCAEGFGRQHLVVNGADLLVGIFGERGQHARSAVAADHLPAVIAVEIELVAEVDFER